MKLICKVGKGESKAGFETFIVVLDICNGDLREVKVQAHHCSYDNSGYLTISSGGIDLNPATMKVSARDCDITTLLLHIEICRAVTEFYPELVRIRYSKDANKLEEQAE